jgi:hypothetical protein
MISKNKKLKKLKVYWFKNEMQKLQGKGVFNHLQNPIICTNHNDVSTE